MVSALALHANEVEHRIPGHLLSIVHGPGVVLATKWDLAVDV